MNFSWVGEAIVGGIFTVLWWLLKNKDERQEDSIKMLFEKHEEDAKKLEELKLEIARQHYIKPELDAKFDRLEISIKDGMHELGNKFDKLSSILINRE